MTDRPRLELAGLGEKELCQLDAHDTRRSGRRAARLARMAPARLPIVATPRRCRCRATILAHNVGIARDDALKGVDQRLVVAARVTGRRGAWAAGGGLGRSG